MILGYARVAELAGAAYELSRDRQEQLRMERVSLSLDEVRAIKKYATRDAAYVDRVSFRLRACSPWRSARGRS